MEYQAQITIDGSIIPDWTGFTVERRYGQAQAMFSVNLQRPISLETGSTISIQDGYGSLSYLIQDKEIERININSDIQGQRASISGGSSEVTKKAPLKAIYFINQTWLDKVVPSYYYDTDKDIIHRYDPGNSDRVVEDVSMTRLFIPGLPGRDMKDYEFKCVLQSGMTYHWIAEELASEMGCTITIDVPDLDVQKTMVVSADQSYFSTIAGMFNKWNPFIYVDGTEIIVRDYSGSEQIRPDGSNQIALSEDSFSVVSWNSYFDEGTVDHVIINGPSLNWSYKGNKSLQKVQKTAHTLSGETQTLVTEEIIDDSLPDGIPADIKEYASEYSAGERHKVVRTVRTLERITDYLSDKSATKSETIEQYNGNNELVHKVLGEYQFADYDTPLGHTVREWALRGVPGGGQTDTPIGDYITRMANSMTLELISVQKTIFGKFLGDTSIAECDTYIWNRCQYEEVIEELDGTEYKVLSNMMPTHWHDEIGVSPWEADSGYGSDLFLYSIEKVRFDTVSPSLLIKNRTYTKVYPIPSRKFIHEDVPINTEQLRSGTTERSWQYYYKDGFIHQYTGGDLPSGDFHPRLTMSEPDVIEESDAREIALRQCRKRQKENKSARLKLVAPLPGIEVGMSITIPSCTKQYFDWNTQSLQSVEIAEDTFWITGHKRTVQYAGDPRSPQREIEAYDEVEVKKYY